MNLAPLFKPLRLAQLTFLLGAATAAPSTLAYDCTGISAWSGSQIYTTGDKAQLNSVAYTAKWWSKGHSPKDYSGLWQEWLKLGECDGTEANQPPVAQANGPYSGTTNSTIAFSSAGSTDPDGHIAEYHWDFGDGSSSEQANPNHSYSTAGNYQAVLTVTDDDGASHSANSSVEVDADNTDSNCNAPQYKSGTQYAAGDVVSNVGRQFRCDIAGWCSSTAAWAYEPGAGQYWQEAWTDIGACDGGGTGPVNQAPVAKANGPYSAAAGATVNFRSDGSNDTDGQISTYQWDFGDGNSSTAAHPAHSYAQSGSYTVTLSVYDNEGALGQDTAVATISAVNGNQAPVANANGPYAGAIDTLIAFSSAGTSDADGQVVSYQWHFGDGAASTEANPSHSYNQSGTYTVSLTVEDDEGATSTASTTASISNGNSGNKVVGYFPEWGVYSRNYHVKNIHTSGSATKLTHIVYAFGNVQNGQCQIGDSYAAYDKAYSAADSVDGKADSWEAGSLRGNFGQLRRLKKMYPNIKIVWSFGGWTWSDGFGQAALAPDVFANSCYDLVFDPRWSDVFDGIDIDWEYPNDCGRTCDNSGFDGYRKLMQSLRNRFGTKLVTAAIGAGESKMRAADYGGAAQYLDFYMVMSYDYFGAWDANGPTAPHSALHSYDGIKNQGFYSDHSIQTLRSLGVPSDKILLGIGFYGRGWTGVLQSQPGGSATGPARGTYEDGVEDYKVLKQSCPASGTVGGTAYAHCGQNWWSYDTPATITGKMNYVKQQGLGGAFFWELSGDTLNGELINAMDDGLK